MKIACVDQPVKVPTPLRLAFVFLALVMLLIGGLEAWLSWNARTEKLQQAAIATNNLAFSLAQHAQDAIGESAVVLAELVDRVESEGLGPQQLRRLHAVMATRAAALPQLHGLFVYDAQGRWVITSSALIPAGVNNRDREYFQYHLENAERGVHISPAVRSRSTGDWIIPVSRRLNNPDGSFAGVALATLRLSYFSDYYAGFSLDDKGVIVLATAAGSVLVRHPHGEAYIGQSVAHGRIFSEWLPRQPSGTAQVTSVVDGVTRIYGFRRVDRYPLVVEAALSRDAVLAPWREDVRRSVIIVALLLLATLLVGLALIRQIRKVQLTERALRQAHGELEKLAMQDPLTGLANRRRLDQALPLEINRARRNDTPLGLILLDIDHFKRYNDLYGHPAGDACLLAVAEAIQHSIRRPGDLAVRYGGEEIAVLLPGASLSGALLVAQKILQAVRDLRLVHAGNPAGFVTLSAGVHARRPSEGLNAAALIKAADEALYLAKAHGRDQAQASQAAAQVAG